MNEIAAALLVLAEALAACSAPPEPLTVNHVVQGVVTVEREPIFAKVDPDSDAHMAVCGDRIVADVPPPEPPPRTLRREMRMGGSMGGARLVPLVYRWTPFDPFDDSYDTELVWLDGEGNYWCAMSPGVTL